MGMLSSGLSTGCPCCSYSACCCLVVTMIAILSFTLYIVGVGRLPCQMLCRGEGNQVLSVEISGIYLMSALAGYIKLSSDNPFRALETLCSNRWLFSIVARCVTIAIIQS